mmetsp:Transcript_43971/g.83984  ORF Transcript_43971/g.83984 Transcript_43971/m.83984 type:complete len:254 (-) Transcript_43971:479-1240(-)
MMVTCSSMSSLYNMLRTPMPYMARYCTANEHMLRSTKPSMNVLSNNDHPNTYIAPPPSNSTATPYLYVFLLVSRVSLGKELTTSSPSVVQSSVGIRVITAASGSLKGTPYFWLAPRLLKYSTVARMRMPVILSLGKMLVPAFLGPCSACRERSSSGIHCSCAGSLAGLSRSSSSQSKSCLVENRVFSVPRNLVLNCPLGASCTRTYVGTLLSSCTPCVWALWDSLITTCSAPELTEADLNEHSQDPLMRSGST